MAAEDEATATDSEAMEQTNEPQIEVPGQWTHLKKILERGGPFAHPQFQASPELLPALRSVKILVVGAGGLGCELLKNLALMGFRYIDVIDMDTIDLSNLNRQFLFRQTDIDKPKAEVAAKFINERVPGVKVTPHYKMIQDYDEDFYRSFNIIICGLDSIVARRWINGMVCSLVNYDDGQIDPTTIIPIIDGGTEGFKGNARVIVPGMTACMECTLDLFPPQINFPLCTIAHAPRLPEHCIEYVKVMLWPEEWPFGSNIALDGDNPDHIQWATERAAKRAAEYNISGVTYRLTQGVIKHIIPAVASTNAVIAAACTTEAFKLATSSASPMNNYMVFTDLVGIYTHTYEPERKENCLACSPASFANLEFAPSTRLEQLIDYLTSSRDYQMQSPGVRTITAEGKNKTLFMKQMEAQLKPNLKKTLQELDLFDGQELVVVDKTSPNPFNFKLVFINE